MKQSNNRADYSGDSSDVSYNSTEDEVESNSDDNEDLDNNFYNDEEILNAQVFDAPNQDIYNVENFITKVKIEMILPIGKLTRFDHKAHKTRKKSFNHTSTRCSNSSYMYC